MSVKLLSNLARFLIAKFYTMAIFSKPITASIAIIAVITNGT